MGTGVPGGPILAPLGARLGATQLVRQGRQANLDAGELACDSLRAPGDAPAAAQQGLCQLAAARVAQALHPVAERAQAPLPEAPLRHVPQGRGVHVQGRQREAVRGCSIPQGLSYLPIMPAYYAAL